MKKRPFDRDVEITNKYIEKMQGKKVRGSGRQYLVLEEIGKEYNYSPDTVIEIVKITKRRLRNGQVNAN